MKKILIPLFILFAHSLQAQLAPGNIQVGGSVNLSKQTDDSNAQYLSDFESSTVRVAPNMGFFINENVVIGGVLSYQRDKQDGYYYDSFEGEYYDVTITENNFSIGPYLRYYKSLGESSALFLQGSFQLGFGDYESEMENGLVPEFRNKISTLDFSIKPGFSFFLSEHWGVEGTIGALGYHKETIKPDDDSDRDKSSSDNLYLSLSLNSFTLGIQYYFLRK